MNVEALQIIWGQEIRIFFNWLEHIISPLIKDHYNFSTTTTSSLSEKVLVDKIVDKKLRD